jgi:general stress protein 26
MAESDETARAKVMELIKGMRIAMLSTRGPDGKMRSRPMAVSDTAFDGHLYFLTGEGSGKVHDLERDKESVITFADSHKSSYVALRGQASISTDREAIKAHWSEPARAWFPKGADDPDIALVTVKIDEAEYWDSPSGRMVLIYGYAKAVLTGHPPEHVGEHGKVAM